MPTFCCTPLLIIIYYPPKGLKAVWEIHRFLARRSCTTPNTYSFILYVLYLPLLEVAVASGHKG
jgi:hypothetical protein